MSVPIENLIYFKLHWENYDGMYEFSKSHPTNMIRLNFYHFLATTDFLIRKLSFSPSFASLVHRSLMGALQITPKEYNNKIMEDFMQSLNRFVFLLFAYFSNSFL